MKSEKPHAWSSTPPQARFVFHNRDTSRGNITLVSINSIWMLLFLKPGFALRGCSKLTNTPFLSAFPSKFIYLLPITLPHSFIVKSFFTCNIKRTNLETNSHQDQVKSNRSKLCDCRMNGWSTCCQLRHWTRRDFAAGMVNTQLTTHMWLSRIQVLTPTPETRGFSWTTSLRFSSSGSSVHLQIRTHGTIGSSIWREPRKCPVMGLEIIGTWHYKWKV